MNGSRDRRPRWDIGDVLDRTDLSVLLDELTQPAERHGPADVGIAPHPTTTIIELRSRCTATIEATSVGDAGRAITAATLSIS